MMRARIFIPRCVPVAAALAFSLLLGCGMQTENTTAEESETPGQTQEAMGRDMPMGEREGHMMSMGDMMSHMGGMHDQFQEMAQQDHWMHEGSMVAGGEHMMDMSRQMATMSRSMRDAMNDMQMFMQQHGDESEAPMDMGHLEQMEQHMRMMTDQLEAMRQIMSEMPQEEPVAGDGYETNRAR